MLLLLLQGKEVLKGIEDLSRRFCSIRTLCLPNYRKLTHLTGRGPSAQEATMHPIAPPGPVDTNKITCNQNDFLLTFACRSPFTDQ
jgi:hypothetical protein